MKEGLLDLVRAPAFQGGLSGADVVELAGENPVCGDRLRLFVRMREGRIAELRHRATACAATAAVAEAACRALQGRAVEPGGLAALLAGEVERLGGLAPVERHALDLVGGLVARLGP